MLHHSSFHPLFPPSQLISFFFFFPLFIFICFAHFFLPSALFLLLLLLLPKTISYLSLFLSFLFVLSFLYCPKLLLFFDIWHKFLISFFLMTFLGRVGGRRHAYIGADGGVGGGGCRCCRCCNVYSTNTLAEHCCTLRCMFWLLVDCVSRFCSSSVPVRSLSLCSLVSFRLVFFFLYFLCTLLLPSLPSPFSQFF